MTETGLWQPSREEIQRLHAALEKVLCTQNSRGVIFFAASLGAETTDGVSGAFGSLSSQDIISAFSYSCARLLAEKRRQTACACQSPEARQ